MISDLFELQEAWRKDPMNSPGDAVEALLDNLVRFCQASAYPDKGYDALIGALQEEKRLFLEQKNKEQPTKENNDN